MGNSSTRISEAVSAVCVGKTDGERLEAVSMMKKLSNSGAIPELSQLKVHHLQIR